MGRGRPRTVQPWENNFEKHPWNFFPQSDGKRRYLIVGSFPPNKFTSHRERLSPFDEDFFYGSCDNSFWDLFIDALGLDPLLHKDLNELKTWLFSNGWIITDIVRSTRRKNDSALDEDLIVEEWNTESIDRIFKENTIEKIVFTSKFAERNFHSKVRPRLQHFPSSAKIRVLISPSKNGLRRLSWFQSVFRIKPLEDLSAYRQRYYRHFLK